MSFCNFHPILKLRVIINNIPISKEISKINCIQQYQYNPANNRLALLINLIIIIQAQQ